MPKHGLQQHNKTLRHENNQGLDLAKLAQKTDNLKSEKELAAWGLAWEARLLEIMTDLRNLNSTHSPANKDRVASAYVELLAAIDQLQRRI